MHRLLWTLIATCLFALTFSANTPAAEPLTVCVSIAPQKYFVQQIGRDRVRVQVMVPPGGSPATYEPVPKQIAALSKANLFIRIGVPFETVWIDRISRANPDMRVIDSQRGIALLAMKGHSHNHDHGNHHQREDGGQEFLLLSQGGHWFQYGGGGGGL